MARRKKSRGGRRKIIRIAATAGAVGGALNAYAAYKASGAPGIVQAYSGYNTTDGTFNIMNASSLHATLAGAIISKVGSKLGINSMLPKGFGL